MSDKAFITSPRSIEMCCLFYLIQFKRNNNDRMEYDIFFLNIRLGTQRYLCYTKSVYVYKEIAKYLHTIIIIIIIYIILDIVSLRRGARKQPI